MHFLNQNVFGSRFVLILKQSMPVRSIIIFFLSDVSVIWVSRYKSELLFLFIFLTKKNKHIFKNGFLWMFLCFGKESAFSQKTEIIVSYLLKYFYHLVMLEVKPNMFEILLCQLFCIVPSLSHFSNC